ncbi:uncharacterized protein LOC144650548 isoform X3 [Oculina patagonica]
MIKSFKITFSFRICKIMLQKHYFGILVVIISSAELKEALKTCKEQTRSTYGHYLAGHVISTRISPSLSSCVIMCSYEFRCKSMNFIVNDKSCDLNDADRHTHPEDYGPKEGSVYMDTTDKHRKKGGFKSCAEIHQELPQAESGYYWVKIGNREAQVYCDMETYGGGWTLVVSISSKNNDHLQRNANNCLNSILCVLFNDNDITGRKLSDEDIHKLAKVEVVHASSLPQVIPISGRPTTVQVLMKDIAFTIPAIEFLMDMMMGSVTMLSGSHLRSWLEDEPCMVYHVPRYLKVTVLEYIETMMGCCM